jgi:hypothetical protein
VIFSCLRVRLLYALLGVVSSKIVSSGNSICQATIGEVGSFNSNGVPQLLSVLVLVLVLALVGMGAAWTIWTLEECLSRWQ